MKGRSQESGVRSQEKFKPELHRGIMKKLALISICLLLLAGCSTKTVTHTNLRAADLAGMGDPLLGEEGSRLEELPFHILIQQGRDYLSQGNLSLARIHFLVALKKDPEAAEGYAAFGDLQMKAGNVEAAKTAYMAALEKQSNYLPAMIALGRLHRGEGDLESALEVFEQAQELSAENIEILTERAITLDELERYAHAEALLLRTVELRPKLAATHNNLGFHYLMREMYPEAIDALRQALRRNVLDARAQNNLAVAYVLNGEAEKAFELFRRTVGDAAAWNNIGYIYMTQGKREQAERAFRRALELNPQFYALAKQNLDRLNEGKSAP
jgi:Flp pilus assembly protein TadD